MRIVAIVMLLGGALAAEDRPLAAQRAGQFEAGAFGAYTRYDPAFGLANKLGGGTRLGYYFADALGLEADVLFQSQYTVSPLGTPITVQPLVASASVVANVARPGRVTLYLLGGYSLLDFGTRAPYRFTDNALHGGAGMRLFVTERVAFRLEGRAVYTPSTRSSFGSRTAAHYVATAGLSVLHLGAPRHPRDGDGDGVPDGADRCPDTPAGVTVDATGCPVAAPAPAPPPAPPPPAPPAQPAPLPAAPPPALPAPSPPAPPPPPAAQPAPPCPPAPPGSKVDARGCLILFEPEAARPPAPGAPPRPTLVLRGVNFETGKSALTADSHAILDAVAASLLANPDIRIEIAGYTDSTGTRYGNFRLSQARAAAVRAYLARKGVAPTRMIAKGYGATGFIAPNATPEGRAQNRRVELHKLP